MVITKTRSFLFFFHISYIAEIKVHGCAEPAVDLPRVLSTETLSQTGTDVGEQGLEKKKQEKRSLRPSSAIPGRPGRPIFILNDNP